MRPPWRKHTSDDITRTLNRIVQAAARGVGLVLQPAEVERVAMALMAAEQTLRHEEEE